MIIVAQKLRPYFQAHTIVVQTNKPLQKMMNNLETARRLIIGAQTDTGWILLAYYAKRHPVL